MIYTLKEIPIEIHLGTTDAEQRKKQIVKISLTFENKNHKKIESDNLEQVTDYKPIYDTLIAIGEDAKCQLLESLHAIIMEKLTQKFPQIKIQKLRIEKFPFPQGSIVVEGS